MLTSTEEVAAEETLINLDGVYRESNIQQILDDLDRELVGLVPVKTRIREIASLGGDVSEFVHPLVADELRQRAPLFARRAPPGAD